MLLVGDSAGRSDPSFGHGQSLALRDVRVLRDCLLADDDWHAAAERYAVEHHRYFAAMHTLESWRSEVVFGLGPEADARRQHADAALARGEAPDTIGRGPDQPTDAAARRRYLGV